jgi:hypothetical protein
LTKENVLKLFSAGYLTVTLSRDFDDQMHQNAAFQKLKIFMGFSDFR